MSFIPKGFLLSSTPVQSPEEDSGYYGSNHRKTFYGSNTYSPIKELSLKNLEHDFDDVYAQSKFINKILDYKNFTKDVYESSSIEINEFSELESTSNSVRANEICKPSEEKALDIFSSSDYSENEDCSFNSFSKDEDIKYKLFDYFPSDLIQENHKCFKSLKNELSPRITHVKHDLQSLILCQQTKIDFIHRLKDINCLSLISCIFSYLSPKELCIASCVNKEWCQTIQSDYNANFRRKTFLEERDLFFNGPSKENRLGMRSGPARELKRAFSNLTNINDTDQPPSIKDSNTRFESFVREGKKGHLKLLKCPKCYYASKCLNGNNYMCTICSHTFCSNCLDPVFKNHTCTKSQLPNIIIGSKKSKKNLRRL